MTKVVHLHWSWAQGPKLLRGVTRAITLCGAYALRGHVTTHADDATCPDCLARSKSPAKRTEEAAPPAPPRHRVVTLRALRKRAP